mmetsp:Transcript_92481/g.265980  ORF Transcript_92481/g.265980 Transcript_92481/m.265980 type:complete len:250 (-) Transcript_92481:19-768(-)
MAMGMFLAFVSRRTLATVSSPKPSPRASGSATIARSTAVPSLTLTMSSAACWGWGLTSPSRRTSAPAGFFTKTAVDSGDTRGPSPSPSSKCGNCGGGDGVKKESIAGCNSAPVGGNVGVEHKSMDMHVPPAGAGGEKGDIASVRREPGVRLAAEPRVPLLPKVGGGVAQGLAGLRGEGTPPLRQPFCEDRRGISREGRRPTSTHMKATVAVSMGSPKRQHNIVTVEASRCNVVLAACIAEAPSSTKASL